MGRHGGRPLPICLHVAPSCPRQGLPFGADPLFVTWGSTQRAEDGTIEAVLALRAQWLAQGDRQCACPCRGFGWPRQGLSIRANAHSLSAHRDQAAPTIYIKAVYGLAAMVSRIARPSGRSFVCRRPPIRDLGKRRGGRRGSFIAIPVQLVFSSAQPAPASVGAFFRPSPCGE